MKIGITYDLRSEYLKAGYSEEETAEFDKEDTINSIERALSSLGHEPCRIGNLMTLVRKLADGKRWDMVFNIAEGLYGFGRESQVPAILDAYQIPYVFSDPLTLSLTLHKGMAKHVVRDSGIPTPDFAVVKTMDELDSINLPFPLFAKPVAEGTGKGVSPASKIQDQVALRLECDRLLNQFKQPVLVETFLPGREFTVGIVGNGKDARSIGIMEIILKENAQKEVYSYHNKEFWKKLVEYRKVKDVEAREAEKVALACWRALCCQDGGRIDLRSDIHGKPHFIEVNPLAGLNPEHSDLCIIAGQNGISYQKLIGSILESAIARLGLITKSESH